ncbi:all-trans retinoic acid-induced differentiation factor isoform X2 [Gracilinanus agilis]|uniref:all-trans retinoic acid-induced differentiation factor isoform X2 n=1 Tax=Gracilinanus agilis TaxID=191870 RepID=UPI001CFC950A|nr:all-trans retinoic acid-induced differentiation factor isoform X2 [Gracilinanus agilis]
MVLDGLAGFLAWVSRAMALLLVLSAGRSLAVPEVLKRESVCKYCPGPVHDTSEVDYYCKQRQELKLYARCCLTEQGTIVGLDLQNCSLKVLDLNFVEAHSAIVLDLQANPFLNISTSVFRNFTELQILVLPPNIDCPGGDYAWDNVTRGPDNYTCLGQRSQCNSTMEQALCPENAYCVPDGPGLFQCLCTSGFHGYKCLREALPPFASPSCSGGPSFEKSKPPDSDLPIDLKIK